MFTQSLRIKLSLILTYFVFAILLNSVGTVILQVITHYGVAKPTAAVLEAFKDISIAVVSFAVASFLPRFGYRKSIIAGLGLVALACLAMPVLNSFFMIKILFLCVGIAFALVKISVYSTIGLIVKDKMEHAGLMNTIEGMFMVGVLSGYWLFSFFIAGDGGDPAGWLNVYWALAGLCAVNILLLLATPFDESGAKKQGSRFIEDFLGMLRLVARPMVYIFVIAAFLYVLIEQGIGTWLPTFNREILKLPQAMSVQAASIFAAGLAIGRLSAGVLMRRIGWYPILNVCVISMGLLVVLTLPLTRGIEGQAGTTWLNAPLAAYVFPLIGLFMAPIYPAISSVMLSALPKTQHAAMTGLIVIFSALGGTTGSLITGFVFGKFSGQFAFYLSLLPMGLILLALFLFKRESERIMPTAQGASAA